MPISFRLMAGVVVAEFFFGSINTGFPSNSCSPQIQIPGCTGQVPAKPAGIAQVIIYC